MPNNVDKLKEIRNEIVTFHIEVLYLICALTKTSKD